MLFLVDVLPVEWSCLSHRDRWSLPWRGGCRGRPASFLTSLLPGGEHFLGQAIVSSEDNWTSIGIVQERIFNHCLSHCQSALFMSHRVRGNCLEVSMSALAMFLYWIMLI